MATAGIGRQSRLCVILVKVGTPVTRAVFEKRVKDLTPPNYNPSPWTIDQFLSANKPKIRSLKLPYPTLAKIFPVQSHTVKLEHWDLTLLCSILTECCDLRQDTRLDIYQLRKSRNKFFHMSEPSIDEHKYQHYLAKLKVIFDRCLKEINDDAFTNEMNKMFEDLEHGHFSQVDVEEVMKQLKSMEEETKEKLTELGRNQQFTNEGIKEIIQRLEVIETVAKDLKSHITPATGVEIAVKNCSIAKEKEISERLVQYFEEFIRDDVEFPKLPGSCQQNIRVAVFKACKLFLSKDYKVIEAKEMCVFLTFNFSSLVSLMSLLRECVSGELTLQLQEVQAAVRMLDGCEDVTLEAVINTEEVSATLYEIELTISSFMESGNIPSKWASSTDKNADVKIREVRLVKRNSKVSSDAANGLQVSFENCSPEYIQRLEESFENGEIDTAMQRIQEAVASEFQTTGISITAQLIQENKSVEQEKTSPTNSDVDGRKRADSHEIMENLCDHEETIMKQNYEFQNMPLTKTSPSAKAKSTECSSTKGRGRPSEQRAKTPQTEKESAGYRVCIEHETCNDSKTRTPNYTPHHKTLKSATVNASIHMACTAAKYTPINKTLKSQTVNDSVHKACTAAKYTPHPKTLKSETVNDTVNKACTAAKYTPINKTLKSQTVNDSVHKACTAAKYTPHPKTLKSETVNDTVNKACTAAKYTPINKTLKSQTVNDYVQKACTAAKYTPHPKTLKSEIANDSIYKVACAANYTLHPKLPKSVTNKNDQSTRSNACSSSSYGCDMETTFSVTNSKTLNITRHILRPDEPSMKTLYTEREHAKAYIEKGSPRRAEKPYKTTDITTETHSQDDNIAATSLRVYTDNAKNRRHGRVGMQRSSVVTPRKTNLVSQQIYKDTYFNRKLGRVGKPIGPLPRQKCATTTLIPEILEKIKKDEVGAFTKDYWIATPYSDEYQCALLNSDETKVKALDQAICQYNRAEAELSWQRQSEMPDRRPKTIQAVLEDYEGKTIPFSDLKLYRKIGQGGFGEVYFAKCSDSVVAVKKLKETKLSAKKITDFAVEIMNFCSLKHHNIVKFIGACTEVPNICIVMEYMQMSLHEAIHIRNDIDFSDTERTSIVKQICDGVKYLHASRIAHCDLKTMNVLLDYVEGEVLCEVKITDFGLSMVKAFASDSSSCSVEKVRNAGTPRYSAPEVLRGENLTAKDMMKADVYSLSLIHLETLFEQEPFPNYGRQELQERVGQQGEMPEIPDGPAIDHRVKDIIQRALSFKPKERPDIAEICDVFRQKQNIYAEEIPLNILT